MVCVQTVAVAHCLKTVLSGSDVLCLSLQRIS